MNLADRHKCASHLSVILVSEMRLSPHLALSFSGYYGLAPHLMERERPKGLITSGHAFYNAKR